jgi:hypothetical protein
MRAVLFALTMSLAAGSATAQESTMVVAPSADNVLHTGTAVQLETRNELTTEHKALRVGQQVELDVLQPVLLNAQVVIPAGSRAMGEITTVRNKGMWGKSGGFTGRVLYVEANGRHIKLNGSFTDRGETGTGGVVASVALLPVAGFFVTGTSARLAPGTHVTAFVAEEVAVSFADGGSAHDHAIPAQGGVAAPAGTQK